MKPIIYPLCLVLLLGIGPAYAAKPTPKAPQAATSSQKKPDALKIPEGKILVDKKEFEELRKEINQAVKTAVGYFEEELILEDKFVDDIQVNYRKKVDKVRAELRVHSTELLKYSAGASKKPDPLSIEELSHLDGANYQCIMSIWALTYAYDLTSIFALSNSQYSIYPQLKLRLEYSLKVFDESVKNLSKVASQSGNEKFQKAFAGARDKAQQAKEVIESLKAQIDLRYEKAKKRKR